MINDNTNHEAGEDDYYTFILPSPKTPRTCRSDRFTRTNREGIAGLGAKELSLYLQYSVYYVCKLSFQKLDYIINPTPLLALRSETAHLSCGSSRSSSLQISRLWVPLLYLTAKHTLSSSILLPGL